MSLTATKLVLITSLLLLPNAGLAQTIRLNVGGSNYRDRQDNVWVADDKSYIQEKERTVAWSTNANIQNTRDDELYQTDRFIRYPSLKFSIPIPEPGDYEVKLHFSENFRGAQAAGKRIFHVAIEGKLEMKNVDIFKEAGGGFRAMSKSVRTMVSGPTIEIEFVKVTQNPKVNAIEIRKLPRDTSPIPIHPDITSILDVVGGDVRPLGMPWADSYSIGDRCYCMTTYDHNIDIVQVDTAAGWMSVREACELIGPGPGYQKGYPIYNTVQCGHGPLNDAGDEHVCPGRVDSGFDGCGHIGPKWNFEAED